MSTKAFDILNLSRKRWCAVACTQICSSEAGLGFFTEVLVLPADRQRTKIPSSIKLKQPYFVEEKRSWKSFLLHNPYTSVFLQMQSSFLTKAGGGGDS